MLLLLLMMAALATRLINLDRYSGSYPEGVRAEQLLLMSLGYRPFKDIFSDQGPWLLDALYPGFALFGPNLVGARAVVVLASLVGLGGVYWVGRQLGGRLAGLCAVGLLVLSPTYLKFSRLAVAELVALAPAVLALGAALRCAGRGGYRWLVASGALFGLSLLMKPIALGVGPAIALALLWRKDRWQALALFGAVAGLTVLLGMILVGLPEIIQQIVVFRWQSRAVEGWSFAANLARAREELAEEGLAIFLLGALGLGLALVRRWAWPVAAWALFALATVAVHSPLHAKHFTLVVMPSALLGGLAIGWSASYARQRARPGGVLALLPVLGLLLLYAGELPEMAWRDRQALVSRDLFDRDGSIHWYENAIETLKRATPSGSYVVTDHAYLAFAARNPVPPFLAEASSTRVRAGTLTDQQAIEHTRRFDSRAILLWADKLGELRRYRAWIPTEYRLVKIWAAEGGNRPQLWLPRQADQQGQRRVLRAVLRPGPADLLDGRLRVVALGLDRDETYPGNVVNVELEWEAVQPTPSDHLVELSLRGADGRVIDEEREPLLGGRTMLEPGWWLFWTAAVRLPDDLRPGQYEVYARVRDRVNRRLAGEIKVGAFEVRGALGR